jgi:hypothetical protein
MDCVDAGVTIATVETPPVRGPNGASVVLQVSSSDDYSKDSHLCMADYKLVFTPANGAPVTVDFLAADDDYGRKLSLRLDGFSQDGKRVLGIISESTKTPYTFLVDYHTADGSVQLVDLAKLFARALNAGCEPAFGVIGTTASGAIVLELDSPKACASNGRWLVDPAGGNPRRLPQAASFLNLYNGE